MKSSPGSAPDSAHDEVFHPFCPRCRYDLATLPDGPCPECGTPFTLAHLKLAPKRRPPRTALAGLRAAAWALGWFGGALFLASVFDGEHADEISFLWAWVSLAWVVRHDIARSPLFAFLATFVPATECVSLSGQIDLMQNYPPTFARASIYLCAMLAGVVLICSRRARCLRASWAGLICGVGAPVFLYATQGLANHQRWSIWPDIRWWQPYSNFPFTNEKAAWIGAGITLAGMLTALVPPNLAKRDKKSN